MDNNTDLDFEPGRKAKKTLPALVVGTLFVSAVSCGVSALKPSIANATTIGYQDTTAQGTMWSYSPFNQSLVARESFQNVPGRVVQWHADPGYVNRKGQISGTNPLSNPCAEWYTYDYWYGSGQDKWRMQQCVTTGGTIWEFGGAQKIDDANGTYTGTPGKVYHPGIGIWPPLIIAPGVDTGTAVSLTGAPPSGDGADFYGTCYWRYLTYGGAAWEECKDIRAQADGTLWQIANKPGEYPLRTYWGGDSGQGDVTDSEARVVKYYATWPIERKPSVDVVDGLKGCRNGKWQTGGFSSLLECEEDMEYELVQKIRPGKTWTNVAKIQWRHTYGTACRSSVDVDDDGVYEYANDSRGPGYGHTRWMAQGVGIIAYRSEYEGSCYGYSSDAGTGWTVEGSPYHYKIRRYDQADKWQ